MHCNTRDTEHFAEMGVSRVSSVHAGTLLDVVIVNPHQAHWTVYDSDGTEHTPCALPWQVPALRDVR